MANSFFSLLPFEFASPIFLLGGAVVMLVFWLFSLKRKPKQQYSDFRILGKRGGKAIRLFIWTLVIIITLSLSGAFARPQVIEEKVIPIYARDFIVAFDFSGSMDDPFQKENGTQIQKSKFNVGRDATFSFIERRDEDRFGFVLFAVNAYSMPLLEGSKHILENPALKDGLEREKVTLLDQLDVYDTRIDKGIFSAITIFDKMSTAETQIIILMTDLVDEPKEPIFAMKEAKRAGIDKIYILHVVDKGISGGMAIRTKSAIESELGKFVRIFDIEDDGGLERAYDEIDKFEKSKTSEKVIESRESISEYFIALALMSFMLLGICSFTSWKKIL